MIIYLEFSSNEQKKEKCRYKNNGFRQFLDKYGTQQELLEYSSHYKDLYNNMKIFIGKIKIMFKLKDKKFLKSMLKMVI